MIGRLTLFALCLSTLLHLADRVIAGLVQCSSQGCLPW